MSASKSADAKYITLLTQEEVLIYYTNEIIFLASVQAILIGWRFKTSGLWK